VADLERLRRYSVRLVGSQEADGLRQEALYKALSGERQCRRDGDVVTFLARSMRSITWSGKKAAKRRPTVSLEDVGGAIVDDAADDDPHEQLVQAQECQRIREEVLALFDDDPDTRLLVEGIMLGMEGQELCELVSIDTGELATKRRLIRRRIERGFPQGWHHDS
jgi:DNA-directed RNA polymerase specialized sigma24 family protein